MKITEELVTFVKNTDYQNFGENTIAEAKRCILDGVGVTIAGSRKEAAQFSRDFVREIGGKQQATTLGIDSIKTSATNAALVNGVACHILDFDDIQIILGGHPTAVILPVVLALGEFKKATGKEILAAFILGVEVSCKIGRGVNPSHYQSGYHVTSTIGILGAVASAGRLLGLNHEEFLSAFGIAGSMSSGLKENFGTMTKSLHAGLAASNGIAAAMLAKKGCTASKRILEGDLGFCNVLAKGAKLGNIVGHLGNPWEIQNPGITRKKYPSCGRTHTAIDSLLGIVRENRINEEDLEEITCATDDVAFDILIHPEPKTELEAKFSMPFCLAIAFLEKDVLVGHFTQEKIEDPRVIRIMKKIRHVSDQEIADRGFEYRLASKVKVKLRNGKEFFGTVEKPRGEPQNPLSHEEIIQKFCNSVVGILDSRKIDTTLRRINHLENEKDISDLVGDLTG
jgi:2-methylcitrate dehydratase PrpD